MKLIKRIIILLITTFSFNYCAFAQEKITTIGLQFKPIYSSPFFGTGPINIADSGFFYNIKPGWGFSGGMVIRKGYRKNLSIEYGINYTRRNYNLKLQNTSLQETNGGFKIIAYEIPFSQLIFIRLSERLYMNAAAGICINMFPSDIARGNENYGIVAGRTLIFNPSLLANIGIEYRTSKSGYFYLGTTLNRPFKEIYSFTAASFLNNAAINSVSGKLNGAYLTFDFKYFFYENPEKKIKRKTIQKSKK
jgi:hypothetical protein